jgi:molybdopterin molybdotransferase
MPGKIRDSNSAMLMHAALAAGCEVRDLGVVSDVHDSTYDAIKAACGNVDVLITSGGVR